MIQIKVCPHFKNTFAQASEGVEVIVRINLEVPPAPNLINYLKHLKENQECYNYSGLTVSVDDILKQMKNNLLEMLKMLET
jgi:hypothetical protein